MEYLHQRKFSAAISIDIVARDWRSRGYSCDMFTDPPGREWRDFVHDCDELLTVVEGRLALTIGDTTLTAEPGDEVFIPRGANHTVRNVHDGTTRWLYGYQVRSRG